MTNWTAHRGSLAAVLVSAAVVSLGVSLRAQDDGYARPPGADVVRASYEKHEYRIPMRDGVKLFTVVYTPRDTSQSYPIMMNRTPYSVGPYGDTAYKRSLGPSPAFMRDGYIFVYQDVRGRYMSEGTYVYMTPHIDHPRGPQDTDESTDEYDSIDWLLKNVPHNNGRVGLWGISADGFLTASAMIDAHPALKAASPQAPLIDWYMGDDRHHHGALMLAQTFRFLSGFDRPRPGPVTTYGPAPTYGTQDGYNFFLRMGPNANADVDYFHHTAVFWDSIMKHDTYDDFWQKRSLAPHLHHLPPGVLYVAGWYDAEDPYGPLEAFRATQKQAPESHSTLVVGPWCHGCWAFFPGDSFGPIPFGQRTGVFYRDSIEVPFFACYLKDRCGTPLPKAIVFETGTDQWRRYDEWPPKDARATTFYLRGGGALSMDPPGGEEPPDRYVSDPNHPVPYTTATSFGYYREYPIEDQRFAAARPDVVVYQTPELRNALTLAGPITVKLNVSSSGTDSDWIVKVIDVHPDSEADPQGLPPGLHMSGYEELIRGDVMRGKFRRSFTTPTPLVPNQPTTVSFTIQDVFHTLKPGHRLMVQVQSTWFPLVDRNPQTFTDINTATASDFHVATERIYHSPSNISSITVPVLPSPVVQ
jgi:uncharacterized protein